MEHLPKEFSSTPSPGDFKVSSKNAFTLAAFKGSSFAVSAVFSFKALFYCHAIHICVGDLIVLNLL